MCDKRQMGWYVDEEEDGYEKIQSQRGSSLESFARLDVASAESGKRNSIGATTRGVTVMAN